MIVITGPTGSGKSRLAMQLAQRLNCDIVSADSRQMYRGLEIGTASPTEADRRTVAHHFVQTLEIEQYYNAAQFESDVEALLPSLWEKAPYVVLCGGSMLYVDAVMRGIDDIPTISEDIRRESVAIYEKGGLQALRLRLLELDPVYYREADLNNHKRLIHAIEVCQQSGRPFSSLRTGIRKQRPYKTVAMYIDRPRQELFERINSRVDEILEEGLEKEAERFFDKRHLNSLNTVGYKEMFAYLEGSVDYETMRAKIARNTRVYAKKQLTWLKSRPEIKGLDAHSDMTLEEQALQLIRENL